MAIGQNATLTECPKAPNGILFATYWYRIPAIPNFRICSHCFTNRIARTQFATYFENFWHSPFPGEDVCCNFNTGKAHQLFDYATQSGDLEPFITYATHRIGLQRCPGTEGASGIKGLRWYGIRELNRLVVHRFRCIFTAFYSWLTLAIHCTGRLCMTRKRVRAGNSS